MCQPEQLTKPPRKEPEALVAIRAGSCVVCEREGIKQLTLSQAHHRPGGGKSIKTPDRDAIPVCLLHHTGDLGVETLGVKSWDARFGSFDTLLAYDRARRTRP